jgi:DNA-binding CsgD family transcriptional regulator
MLAAAGSTDEAIACLSDVISEAEKVGAVWPLIPALTTLSRLLVVTGNVAGALERSRAGLEHVRAKGNWVWGAELVLCFVDAHDRASEAQRVVEELADGIAGADAPRARAALDIARGVIARDLGDNTQAEALVDSARRELAEGGLPYEAALATERMGTWRCERGAADGSRLLRRALHTFGELDASRDVARILQTMRANGVRVPNPRRGGRRSYGADLSPREREVALLAAKGKTNEEIAADLFLSRRTVETHMSNVLRKLRGRSRRDLRRLLNSNGEATPDS